MSREKQIIDEMAGVIYNDSRLNCELVEAVKISEAFYNAGYRKQSEGEWVIEVKHFFDDYGDLRIYAIAHCSQCKTPYKNNKDIYYERIERPENLNYCADWNIDVEPIKKRFFEKVKTKKGLHKYCHECGAKMKGGAE